MAPRAAPLILASKSASRQALLRNAGVPYEAVAADIDERAVQASSGATEPDRIAALLARAKAEYVSALRKDSLVLGADQTLSLGNRMFNKPAGRDQAHAQLRALAGQTHTLHSAIAVLRDGKVLFEHLSAAHMTMRAMSDEDISRYLDAAGDAVTTSVGCYQLEGLGVRLFDKIDGDHFTILGLPLLPLLAFLRAEQQLSF